MSTESESRPALLQIDVPVSQAQAGPRALVRVSCAGWARLRIAAPGEPVRTRWLGPGRHALSFTAAFGQQVTVERASLLSRHHKTVQLPLPHWSLRPAGLEAQAELRALSDAVVVPAVALTQRALAPTLDASRLDFSLRPEALAMRPEPAFVGRIEPILDGQLQPRLSVVAADISTEAITLKLNAQAFEPVIPDLNLSPPSRGGLPDTTRLQDQQGASR